MENKYQLSHEKQMLIEYIKQLTSEKIKSNCIPSILIFGEPGAGKTSFGKYCAEVLGSEYIFAPCYEGVGAEQLVYNWDLGILVDAMTDADVKGRHAMKDGYLLQALKLSNTKKVLLLIDEIDKAKPSVDTFLLSFLQECMLNDPLTGPVKGKKENIFIIFTSNKKRDLEDALDRRFTMIREFDFPNKTDLLSQVESMLSIKYNQTKIQFVIDLAVGYRSLGVEKKPSQNQISDLIQELYAISKSSFGRKTSYKLKYESMLWKFSQDVNDHAIFEKHLKDVFRMKNLQNYIGSML